MADTQRLVHSRGGQKKVDFYLRLHALGIFPADAPATIRAFGQAQGQLSIEELIDRYRLQCKPSPRPDRGLPAGTSARTGLRQPGRDLVLPGGAVLGRIEALSPGISTLRLPPELVLAWKEDLQTLKRTVTGADGRQTVVTSPRLNPATNCCDVRAFYLDIAQWATGGARPLGAMGSTVPGQRHRDQPCQRTKRRKARMDQRTRERLPVLPVLTRTAAEPQDRRRRAAAAARQTAPGERSSRTAAGRCAGPSPSADQRKDYGPRTPPPGKRRNLTYEEERSVLGLRRDRGAQLTGSGCEELLELTHHSHHRLPTALRPGSWCRCCRSPLQDRYRTASPGQPRACRRFIGDHLPASAPQRRRSTRSRLRQSGKTWNPPMRLLFQRTIGGEKQAFTPRAIIRRSPALLATRGSRTRPATLSISPRMTSAESS